MKRFSRRSSFRTVADINIVPLVDLVFCLLIIFMLATPLLEQVLEIQVPTAEAGAPVEPQTTRVIAIDKAGRVFLDNHLTDIPAVRNEMIRLAAANPDIAVLVRTDRQAQFETFAKVVDVLKVANVQRMGVITVNEASTPASASRRER